MERPPYREGRDKGSSARLVRSEDFDTKPTATGRVWMCIDTTLTHSIPSFSLTTQIGGTGFQASGVLISPDEVLTASHVVFNSTLGAATSITVAPGYNAGSRPFGTATGTFIHFSNIQDPGDIIFTQQSQLDSAVIHLSRPFTGLGTMGLGSNFAGGLVNVAGYPAVFNGQLQNIQENLSVDPNFTVLRGLHSARDQAGPGLGHRQQRPSFCRWSGFKWIGRSRQSRVLHANYNQRIRSSRSLGCAGSQRRAGAYRQCSGYDDRSVLAGDGPIIHRAGGRLAGPVCQHHFGQPQHRRQYTQLVHPRRQWH